MEYSTARRDQRHGSGNRLLEALPHNGQENDRAMPISHGYRFSPYFPSMRVAGMGEDDRHAPSEKMGQHQRLLCALESMNSIRAR
jgi:hypothetical protein